MKKRYLLYILLLVPLVVYAAVTTITTAGNWNDPTIWLGLNIADDFTEDADMNDSIGTVTIQNGDFYTISNFQMNNDNTLTIDAGGSLTIGSMAENHNISTGNTTTINVNGNLEIWGILDVANDLVLNVTLPGVMTIHGDLNAGNDASIDIQGILTIEGDLNGGNNTDVNVAVGGTMNVNGSINVGNGSSLTGAGTVNVGGGCNGPITFCESGPLAGVATASAGPDATVCYDQSHTLVGMATSGTIEWSTSGDGGWDDDTLEDPEYTFGANDISNGSVTLTMEVTGSSNTAVDDMVLTIDKEPVLDPGLDVTVCSNVTSGVTLDDDGLGTAAATFNITAINFNGLTDSAGTPVTGTGFEAAEIFDDAYTNLGLSPVNVVYSVVPVSAGGCLGTLVDVTVTIKPEPVLDPGLGVTKCSELTSGITLNDDGSSVNAATFNITAINFNGLSASAGSPGTGSGFGSAEISNDAYTNNGPSPVNVVYTVIPVSVAGCLGDPVNVIMTVNPEPVLDPGLSAAACNEVATGIVLNDDGSSVDAETFDITAIDSNGLIPSAGAPTVGFGFEPIVISDDAYTNTEAAPVDVIYTVVPVSDAGCLGDAVFVTVTVNPEPLYTGNLDVTVCSDVGTGVVLPATDDDSGVITSYDVTAVVGGGLTGTATTEAGTTNINLINTDVFNNVTNAADIVTYTITPYFGLCSGTEFDIVVTINPQPDFTGNLDVTVCTDVATGVVLPGTDDDSGVITSYDVSAVKGGGLTGATSTGAGTTNVNLIVGDVFNNATNVSDIVTYTITPYFGTCPGTDFDIVVTVDPEPLYTGNLDVTVCSDVATGAVLPGTDDDSGVITRYDVSAVKGGGLTGAASTGVGTTNVNLIVGDVFNNATNVSDIVTYTITPYFGTCPGTDFDIVVTVKPEPVLDPGLDVTVCSDIPSGITLDDDGISVNALTFNISTINFNGLTASAGSPTTGSGFGAAQIADDAYTNPGTTPVDVVYTVVPVSGSGCLGDAVNVILTVDPEATANAGPDATVCYNATYTLTAAATNGTILWTTTGDGTFDNAMLEDPFYTFGSTDISGGTVTLTMTVTGNCNSPSDDVVLTADPVATTDAGLDATACSNVPYLLEGTSTNGTILWTTTGDGEFSNATLEDPAYTFGSGDITLGSATLTMTVTGNCNTPSDDVILTVDSESTAAAGSDAMVCYDTPFQLVGTATNGTILWTTAGDGTFDNTTLEDPVYTFGSTDISGGTVTLTMTVTGNCNSPSDDVVLTADPVATTDAGLDATACSNVPYLLEGTSTNGTILWTTTGDGEFSNATLEDPAYTFGSGDITLGSATLTMTVTGNCNTPSDDVILTVDSESTAAAGSDAMVCYDTPFQLVGTTTNGTILWTTAGDGTFNNATLEDPVYTFGSGDIEANLVILTMTVTSTCNVASDDIVLTDDTPPVISNCPADIVVSMTGAGCDETVNWTAPTAKDNCNLATFTSMFKPGDTFPIGITTVTYTATDVSGNSSTCSFTVTVEDRISPIFDFCPATVNISEFDLDSQSAVVTWQTPLASDNCGSPIISSNYNSGDSFPRGMTKVIYTSTDESGNEATCEFEIDIKGNSYPIASPIFLDVYAGEPTEICLEVTDPDGDDLVISEFDIKTLNGEIGRTDSTNSLCFSYTSFDDFEGEDIFYVRVCDDGTPVACADVEVRLQVTINFTLTVYKAFTPDGDNINDFWIIENIDNHPDNRVMIFDRWGGLIFSARGYNNNDIVWDGRSNQSGQGSVPSGTYFYKIDLGEGYPTQKGFIELIQ